MVINITFEVSREETEIPDMTGEEQPAGRARKEARFSMRMQPTRKRQVEYLYKELGMTLSQAVNIYFEACLREYGIPFRIESFKPRFVEIAMLTGVREKTGEADPQLQSDASTPPDPIQPEPTRDQ